MANSISENAVVIGIWGRAGGDGIPELIKKLTPALVGFGVKSDNIFSMSWNPRGNDDPFGEPDTRQHLKHIRTRESEPTYIAIIGHSYGGWAASLLSRKLEQKPNFVGLIDPVFGPTGDSESITRPKGENVHNWYQRNSITEPTLLEDCFGTVVGCPNGVSCGRRIDGIHNHKVKWQKDWDGKPLKRECEFGRKVKRHAYHTSIDSDKHIWHQISDFIVGDLR